MKPQLHFQENIRSTQTNQNKILQEPKLLRKHK
jgi:hypothetical protein